MISRRQLLRASLTVCGCTTCGGLALDAFAHSARADTPTAIKGAGYDLWFIGGQREAIMNGKLAAALDLRTLASRQHLYGIGPIEQLRGEVTIADSRPALARVASDDTVKVTQSFEAGVPFFAWAEVPLWQQVPIPADVRSFEELESFVPKAAAAAGLDADKPLPFLVGGRQRLIEFHIVNRIGDGPHNMEMHKKIQVTFELENAITTIVGFRSTKHRGIFTPGDSNIHIHFQTPDNTKSGHIQKLQFTYAERATDWRGNNNIAESIFNQMGGETHPVPRWVIMSAGTGGTAATLGRYIRYRNFDTGLCVVDVEHSAFFDAYQSGDRESRCSIGSRIEGVGRPRVEPSFVPEVIDCMIKIPDAASIAAMRVLSDRLFRRVGGSTGTNFFALCWVAANMIAAGEEGSLVSLICDSGERYTATYYNDAWLQSNNIEIESYWSMLRDFLDMGRFRFDLVDVKTALRRTL